MRRTLSAILSLAMVLSLFTFLGVMNVAAEVIAISNASPAITANVGDTVDFSNYSVVFDGDSSATANLTWKNEAGTKITTLKIQEKGVVPVGLGKRILRTETASGFVLGCLCYEFEL